MSIPITLKYTPLNSSDLPNFIELIQPSDPISSIFTCFGIGVLEILLRGKACPKFSSDVFPVLTDALENLKEFELDPNKKENLVVFENLVEIFEGDTGKRQVYEWLHEYYFKQATENVPDRMTSVMKQIVCMKIGIQIKLEIESGKGLKQSSLVTIFNTFCNSFKVSLHVFKGAKVNEYYSNTQGAFPVIYLLEIENGGFGVLRHRELVEFDNQDSEAADIIKAPFVALHSVNTVLKDKSPSESSASLYNASFSLPAPLEPANPNAGVYESVKKSEPLLPNFDTPTFPGNIKTENKQNGLFSDKAPGLPGAPLLPQGALGNPNLNPQFPGIPQNSPNPLPGQPILPPNQINMKNSGFVVPSIPSPNNPGPLPGQPVLPQTNPNNKNPSGMSFIPPPLPNPTSNTSSSSFPSPTMTAIQGANPLPFTSKPLDLPTPKIPALPINIMNPSGAVNQPTPVDQARPVNGPLGIPIASPENSSNKPVEKVVTPNMSKFGKGPQMAPPGPGFPIQNQNKPVDKVENPKPANPSMPNIPIIDKIPQIPPTGAAFTVPIKNKSENKMEIPNPANPSMPNMPIFGKVPETPPIGSSPIQIPNKSEKKMEIPNPGNPLMPKIPNFGAGPQIPPPVTVPIPIPGIKNISGAPIASPVPVIKENSENSDINKKDSSSKPQNEPKIDILPKNPQFNFEAPIIKPPENPNSKPLIANSAAPSIPAGNFPGAPFRSNLPLPGQFPVNLAGLNQSVLPNLPGPGQFPGNLTGPNQSALPNDPRVNIPKIEKPEAPPVKSPAIPMFSNPQNEIPKKNSNALNPETELNKEKNPLNTGFPLPPINLNLNKQIISNFDPNKPIAAPVPSIPNMQVPGFAPKDSYVPPTANVAFNPENKNKIQPPAVNFNIVNPAGKGISAENKKENSEPPAIIFDSPLKAEPELPAKPVNPEIKPQEIQKSVFPQPPSAQAVNRNHLQFAPNPQNKPSNPAQLPNMPFPPQANFENPAYKPPEPIKNPATAVNPAKPANSLIPPSFNPVAVPKPQFSESKPMNQQIPPSFNPVAAPKSQFNESLPNPNNSKPASQGSQSAMSPNERSCYEEVILLLSQSVLSKSGKSFNLTTALEGICNKFPQMRSVKGIEELISNKPQMVSNPCAVCRKMKELEDFTAVSCGEVNLCKICNACRIININEGCPSCSRLYSEYELSVLQITKLSMS